MSLEARGLQNKLEAECREDAQLKLQETLQKIINEGKRRPYLHNTLIKNILKKALIY